MDVLIKGMEMPTSCWECPFLDYEEESCLASGIKNDFRYRPTLYPGRIEDGRHEDCPLVSVPPHGPLIDADESIEVQMFDEMYEEWTLKTMSVADYLAFAADMPPTIIESEGGDPDVSIN